MWTCDIKLKKDQELFISSDMMKAKSKSQDSDTSCKFWLPLLPPPSCHLLPLPKLVFFQTGEKEAQEQFSQYYRVTAETMWLVPPSLQHHLPAPSVRGVHTPLQPAPPPYHSFRRESSTEKLCCYPPAWSRQGKWPSLGKAEVIKLR